ncbi:C-GCAxxG-C-C family protein [Clostridium formicaceticum]|uniref:Redox-active protein (C_GCAxxG_C_C) n=1 Tax=Clostridium formicaceticum TaxID=1497 RepID=A0AAC9WFS0_9CLOT|nr:C-GCAxxG-C-C family protein [Clostridium formicaceticum]AOY76565.1 hypothetical protein BJL90_12270 [Clostridium formicaceticum]ARE86984.1 Putative redox-active protein (C_GCAxxG_C_C) [Clostridium formicaceticum]
MNKSDKALQLFNQGCNCAQSVCLAFSEEMGLDKEIALKISCGFGGGMRQGEVCGVVTGAIMILGLKGGQHGADDKKSKELIYQYVKEFNQRFINLNKTIICKELLGYDTSTEDGFKQAHEKGLFKNVCPKLIKDAVSILEEIL